MAYELEEYNVTAISLYPGMVRTEFVMAAKDYFDLSNSESPEFVGRAIVSLASGLNVKLKNGEVCIAAQLANEYGFSVPITLSPCHAQMNILI